MAANIGTIIFYVIKIGGCNKYANLVCLATGSQSASVRYLPSISCLYIQMQSFFRSAPANWVDETGHESFFSLALPYKRNQPVTNISRVFPVTWELASQRAIFQPGAHQSEGNGDQRRNEYPP